MHEQATHTRATRNTRSHRELARVERRTTHTLRPRISDLMQRRTATPPRAHVIGDGQKAPRAARARRGTHSSAAPGEERAHKIAMRARSASQADLGDAHAAGRPISVAAWPRAPRGLAATSGSRWIGCLWRRFDLSGHVPPTGTAADDAPARSAASNSSPVRGARGRASHRRSLRRQRRSARGW